MTIDEAVAAARYLAGTLSVEIDEKAWARHAKHAASMFARRTPVTIRETDLTLTGADSYSLVGKRVGRIWRAEDRSTAGTVYGVQLWPAEKFDRMSPTTTVSGTNTVALCRVSQDTLRVTPAISGTIRLYHSPIVVLEDRGSTSENAETCTVAGTATRAIVASPSRGLKNNNAGASTYYNGCRIRFSGSVTSILTGQFSFITNYQESLGAGNHYWDYFPATSSATALGDTLTIDDVLEVHDDYAEACVNYAAGMVAQLDPKKPQSFSDRLLTFFAESLREASEMPYGGEPETPFEIVQPEDAGEDNWVFPRAR